MTSSGECYLEEVRGHSHVVLTQHLIPHVEFPITFLPKTQTHLEEPPFGHAPQH